VTKNPKNISTSSSHEHIDPPFWGTRIIDHVPISEIEPLLDKEAIFSGRWQFRQGMDAKAWEKFRAERCEPLLARLLSRCRAREILLPQISYGHFQCRQQGNGLIVTDGVRSYRFDFPRERRSPNRCVADFFADGFVTMQIVTVGQRVNEIASEQFVKKAYSENFFLKGLASEAAEALAEHGHCYIRKELGVAPDQGARFSPGFPAFPDLFAQRKMVELLDAKRIGISLTETCQLIPEHPTSAIISIDSKAVHFRP
jgi:5-methyltetrahydrofolate--homocysteine methyltransferase